MKGIWEENRLYGDRKNERVDNKESVKNYKVLGGAAMKFLTMELEWRDDMKDMAKGNRVLYGQEHFQEGVN